MNDFGRAATLGGVVAAAGAGLAYLIAVFGTPGTDVAVGFLVAGALLLTGYAAGNRSPLLGAVWAVPVVAAVLILIESTPAGLQQVSVLLGGLGVATALAWPVIGRGYAIANRFGERFW